MFAQMAHCCLLRRQAEVLFSRKDISNSQLCEEASMPDGGTEDGKYGTKPRMCYIICSSPRSGSTLLAQALRDMGIGHPGEYLNPSLVEKTHSGERQDFMEPTPTKYIARLKQTRTVNGIFGLKTHYTDLARYPEIADHIGTLFPDAKYISITRRNVLRQAISAAKAAQTMAWTSHLERRKPARFNYYAILKNVVITLREIEWWDKFFARHGIKPLRVVYEDLDEDYEGTLRNVINFLRVEGTIPPPPLKKQADSQNDAWVEEFANYFRRKAAIGWAIRLVSRRW
ncbi:MAG: Stf0 family sulfotransferase [Gemmataceae bacterium]